jgi:hypothetical protein
MILRTFLKEVVRIKGGDKTDDTTRELCFQRLFHNTLRFSSYGVSTDQRDAPTKVKPQVKEAKKPSLPATGIGHLVTKPKPPTSPPPTKQTVRRLRPACAQTTNLITVSLA